jgi:hypothetical protein
MVNVENTEVRQCESAFGRDGRLLKKGTKHCEVLLYGIM